MSGPEPDVTSVSTLEDPATFTYLWKIAGVTLERITEAPVDLCSAKSATFSAQGHDWHLEAKFNRVVNREDASKTCVGFYLYLDSPKAEVTLNMKFTCGSFSHELGTLTWSTHVPNPAGGEGNWWGAASLRHALLQSNPGDFIVNGVLTVKATLAATTPALATVGPLEVFRGKAIAVAEPGLAADMRRALTGAARGCPLDVKLLCADGERVPAHSFVLALRSRVFAAMFAPESGLAAVDREGIPVPPEVTSATLRRVLEFIYTDQLTPASAEEAQHLLNAAHVYQLPRLTSICERTLCEQLSVENVGIVLTLAAQHRARALEREAILFAARNVVAVLATEGWAHLSAAKPELKDRVMIAMATGVVPDDAAAGGGSGAAGGAASGAGGAADEAAGAAGGSGANKRARRNR